MLQNERRCDDERSAAPLVLAATILASSIAFIDGTIVTIALPAMQRALDAEVSATCNGWSTPTSLLLGALILVGGGLGDRSAAG